MSTTGGHPDMNGGHPDMNGGHPDMNGGHPDMNGGHAEVERARAVVLVRDRGAGQAQGEVHLIPLPPRRDTTQPDAVSTVCGRPLCLDDLETVRPGDGVWCTYCFISHATGSAPASTAPSSSGGTVPMARRLAAGLAYRRLGWPVRLGRTEVSLDLDLDVDAVALVIPAVLAAEVVEILHRRRCPPPVLAHPALPAHRVIVAGERFGVPLDWPAGVYRVTTTLLLPPSVTAYGPVCWVSPPVPDALRLCREVDVIAALRTALRTPPPAPSAPPPTHP